MQVPSFIAQVCPKKQCRYLRPWCNTIRPMPLRKTISDRLTPLLGSLILQRSISPSPSVFHPNILKPTTQLALSNLKNETNNRHNNTLKILYGADSIYLLIKD